MIARLFEEYLGEPKPVYTVTRRDALGFRDALLKTPAHATKLFPGFTLPEAIKANNERPFPHKTLNVRTINDKHLSKLHSMFNWCKNNEITPDNPTDGVKVNSVKDREPKRLRFSPGDITKIFSPARFDKSKPFGEEQWAELVSLFSGTRLSELAQTKLDSIQTRSGSLVLVIEEVTKNIGSQRVVPVHSTLIALGFEKYVAKLRADGATHLFPIWYSEGMEAKQRAKDRGKVILNHYFPRGIPKRSLG